MSGPGVGDVLELVARMAQAVQAEGAGLSLDPVASDALMVDLGRLLCAVNPAHLRALAAQAEAGVGAETHQGFGDWQEAHDSLLTQTADVRREWEVMKKALVSIRDGSRLSQEWFKSRLGERKYPTWYAVNALQNNTGAAYHTARAALVGIAPEAAPAAADAQAQDGAGAGGT